jgi:predicted MFS family arabinose efflux permease
LRLVHHPRRETFARLGEAVRSPFGLFLAVWVVANLGVNAVYALYPLLIQNVYGIEPGPSSFALAAATGLGLLLFTPSSLLTHRLGGARVLQVALGVRLVMLLVLLASVGATFPAREAVVLVAFAVISLAFPLMSVSSTVLTSSLSPVGQGEGMGIYTSVGALAGLIGAMLGGWAANTVGYPAALLIAVGSVVLALLLSAPLRPPHGPSRRT